MAGDAIRLDGGMAVFSGYAVDAGGGPDAAPIPSTPVGLSEILKSQLWSGLLADRYYAFPTPMFQPVGGMDRIAHAIYELPGHSTTLPSIPPDRILKRFRHRSGGQNYAYVLVAGMVDGKWTLYSNLVAKGRAE